MSGEATSDGYENDEVVWMDIPEALEREDVPMLTKQLIRCALKEEDGFGQLPYVSKNRPGFLYGVDILKEEKYAGSFKTCEFPLYKQARRRDTIQDVVLRHD